MVGYPKRGQGGGRSARMLPKGEYKRDQIKARGRGREGDAQRPPPGGETDGRHLRRDSNGVRPSMRTRTPPTGQPRPAGLVDKYRQAGGATQGAVSSRWDRRGARFSSHSTAVSLARVATRRAPISSCGQRGRVARDLRREAFVSARWPQARPPTVQERPRHAVRERGGAPSDVMAVAVRSLSSSKNRDPEERTLLVLVDARCSHPHQSALCCGKSTFETDSPGSTGPGEELLIRLPDLARVDRLRLTGGAWGT